MMETYWSTAVPFREVPDDQCIEVLSLLEAARGILGFIESLGRAFFPVKNDIHGNIEKMQKKYDMNPEKFKTVNAMLEEEKLTKSTDLASVGGLWLKRGLEFIAAFLQNVVDDHRRGAREENIRPLIMAAYESTLKAVHGWFSAKLFSIVAMAVPYRKDMIIVFALGKEGMDEKVIDDIENFLVNMKANLEVLSKLYKDMGLDNTAKV